MGIVSKVKGLSRKKLPVIGIVSVGVAALITVVVTIVKPIGPLHAIRPYVLKPINYVLTLVKMNPLA